MYVHMYVSVCVSMCLRVFIFLFFSHCVRRFVFCFCLLSLCTVVVAFWYDEHSFVILLRATDWLNVYLYIVTVVVVVVVFLGANEHVCSTIYIHMNLF